MLYVFFFSFLRTTESSERQIIYQLLFHGVASLRLPQIPKLLQPSWKMYCCPRTHFLIPQDKYIDYHQQKLCDRTIKLQTINLNVRECVLKQI